MMGKLYWRTVTPLLKSVLLTLMHASIFDDFRLVGGTSLSLQLGHRQSLDIDLFTDATYGSVDFTEIDKFLNNTFPYVATSSVNLIAFGKSYAIGNNERDAVKLDLYYTDPYIREAKLVEEIRLATLEEIIAMKMDVVSRTARKKDFWDLHELIEHYDLRQMLALHQERYPYGHDEITLIKNLTSFDSADHDFNPICLNGKHWEVIKLDFTELVAHL